MSWSWNCPVCHLSFETERVPSVMDGCMPLAHVVCKACLVELQERNAALCPECRAPFTTVRPLAAFVDEDDTSSDAPFDASVEDRVAAASVGCDPLVRQRLLFAAKRMEELMQKHPEVRTHTMHADTLEVPNFDAANVALNVADGRRRLGLGSSARLKAHMHHITDAIVPLMQRVFPTHRFAVAPQVRRKTYYMPLASVPN